MNETLFFYGGKSVSEPLRVDLLTGADRMRYTLYFRLVVSLNAHDPEK